MNLKSKNSGFTLIETLAAMTILAIAALGTLGYQYHSTQLSRTSVLEMAATRTAQLLLEDWKSKGGQADYDPRSLNIGFVKDTKLKIYRITIDDLPVFAKLYYSDVANDTLSGVTLRQISVVVRWRKDFSDIMPVYDDPHLTLTTFVRLDASGG